MKFSRIRYTDKNGKAQVIDSDNHWLCNNKQAIDLGIDGKGQNNIWMRVKGGPIANMEGAHMIWSPKVDDQVAECIVKLP